jgi:cytidylate kinase
MTRLMQGLIITLDGPAGTGKSTVARELARRLGLEFLDTGAMYRSIAVTAMARGIDPSKPENRQALIELAQRLSIRFDWKTDPPLISADGVDVSREIRDPHVSRMVSFIAAIGEIREVMVRLQQEIGREHPRLLTEGRDQGSVVFPDAPVKIYLDARPEIRARRRCLQLQEMGKPADEKQILDEINDRDSRDLTRKDGPLMRMPDAVLFDTSDLGLDQVLEQLEQIVRERAGLTGAIKG